MSRPKFSSPAQDKLNADKKTSRFFKKFRLAIKTEATATNYVPKLDEFMRYCNFEKYEQVKNLKVDDFQDLMEDYIMQFAHLSYSSNNSRFSAVKLFCEVNRIQIFAKAISKLMPSDKFIKAGDIPLTTHDIQRLLDVCPNLRARALVLFFASTMARRGAIKDEDGFLQIKHFKDMPMGCMAVKIYAGTKYEYWTMLMPEAATALHDYWNWRETTGQNKRKPEAVETLTPESPAFTKYKRRGPLEGQSVDVVMANLMTKAAIERTKIAGNKYDKSALYGMRKRGATILKNRDGHNDNKVEKLLGHEVKLDGKYYRPEPEELFEEFFKSIESFSISQVSKLKFANLELQDKVQHHSKADVMKVFEMMNISIDDLKELAAKRQKDRKFT